LVFVDTLSVAPKVDFSGVTSNPFPWVTATRERIRRKVMWMNREQFEDLMLFDQKSFAGYARLFMNLKGTPLESFLDWCWEKYLGRAQPTPNSTGYGDGNSLFSEERTPYPRI
jgi:hypothetical protein